MNERRVHQIFEVSVLLKGAHALIECIGGLTLAVVSTGAIAALVNTLTQEELIEDPTDFVAMHLLVLAQNFSVSSQHFYAFYFCIIYRCRFAAMLNKVYYARSLPNTKLFFKISHNK